MILILNSISYAVENQNFDSGIQEEINIAKREYAAPTDELIINFALSQDGKMAILHEDGNIDIWSTSGEYLYTFEFATGSFNFIIKYNEDNKIELIEYKGRTKYVIYDDGVCEVSKLTENYEKFHPKYEYYEKRKEITDGADRYFLTNKYTITKYLVREKYTRLCLEDKNGEITYLCDVSKKEPGLIIMKILLLTVITGGIVGGCIYFFKYFDPDKLNF